MADRGARGARALARRFPGPLDQAAVGDAILPPGKAVPSMPFLAPDQGQDCPPPGRERRREQGGASCCWAVFTLDNSRSVRRASSEVSSARATARFLGPAASSKRSAPPVRVALEAIFVPISGRWSGRLVCWPWARSSARVRRRGVRRRQRARGARLSAGETEACGSMPPRRSAAIVWESLVSLLALPPWRACRASA
jgi:hypothetical protein